MCSMPMGKKGMSLVEVVVAIALLAIITTSIGSALSQSSVFSSRIERIYQTSYIAQRRLELLKRFDLAQLPSAVESNVKVDVDGNISSTGKFLRSTAVTSDYDSNASLVKVKVTVYKHKIGIKGGEENTVLGEPVIMETLFTDKK